MSVLTSLIGFLITIGVLVAFHEFGHFWMARKLGVRVLTYSLGFGKTLWSKRFGPDEIEFRVAALPLGGFVKMLDEREGPVPPAERHRAFNLQPVWKRALIVLAGPVANIILAILFWWLMFMIGVQGVLPKVGVLAPGSLLSKAGLKDGDVIVQVAGHSVRTLSDLRLAVLDGAIEQKTVPIQYEHQGAVTDGQLDLAGLKPLDGTVGDKPKDVLKLVGFRLWSPPGEAKIRKVLPHSPAQKGGLQKGDVITRVNGSDYRDPWMLIEKIQKSAGKSMAMTVKRDGRTRTVQVMPQADAPDHKGRIGAEIGLAKPPSPDTPRLLLTERFGPVSAIGHAVDRSWDMTVLTFQVFGGLLTGRASISNLSGPVAIAEYAGKSLVLGISTFFGFLALVSLSLAILNLMPVPMLDGGHLAMYVVEAVQGKPVSERFQDMATRVGLVLLVGLMALAFYNDLVRLMH